MAWQIEWTKEAIKDLSKLEQKEAKAITKKIEAASNNPYNKFERLKGYEDYKLRSGNYRIICLLSHKTKTIIVEKIGHRKNIYKIFSKTR